MAPGTPCDPRWGLSRISEPLIMLGRASRSLKKLKPTVWRLIFVQLSVQSSSKCWFSAKSAPEMAPVSPGDPCWGLSRISETLEMLEKVCRSLKKLILTVWRLISVHWIGQSSSRCWFSPKFALEMALGAPVTPFGDYLEFLNHLKC